MSVFADRVPGSRELFWAHPEWWVVGLGLAAWLPVVQHGITRSGSAHADHLSFAAELGYWHAMVLAMMLPIIATKARDVAIRSFAERRHRAIGLFLIGYLVPWSALGTLAAAARTLAWIPWTHSQWPTVAAFAAATIWALLPVRERAMVMSYGHEPVIAPAGWDADRDCVKAGLAIGSWCFVSCWALMLACVVSGHHLVAVVIGAAIGLVEGASFRPPSTFVRTASLALTAFFAVPSAGRLFTR
jgi:predicted metal-binding membrane protein